jgi:pSer/pThr/pTyr-binding forkhead associated (FHA) protein
MNAQLLGRARGGAPLTLNVPVGESVLGRDNGAQVVIPMDGISRRHARIVVEGNTYWLQDLKSTNGTFLNGSPVAGDVRERLRHLDIIGLGRDAELVFLIREKQEAPAVKRQVIMAAALVLEEAEASEYEIAVGEISLGRSTANNVAVDRAAISKLHARIQRSADQLLLQDLNSVNGTFVNGERQTTALLKDGDRISLANVVSYRVKIEWGESRTSASGIRAAVLTPPPAADAPEFKNEWKTRLEWDESEKAAIAEVRRNLAPPGGGTASVKPAPKPAAPAAPAAKPAAPAPAPPRPAVAEKPAPPVAKPPAAAPAPPKPVAPAVPPPKPVAPAPAAAKPITEVRLSGSGFDLVVAEPGTYDMGRADGARLRLSNATVSRSHSRVILSADRLTVQIEHVGKTTPTLLNGAPVAGPQGLSDGDTVTLGEVALTVKIKR